MGLERIEMDYTPAITEYHPEVLPLYLNSTFGFVA